MTLCGGGGGGSSTNSNPTIYVGTAGGVSFTSYTSGLGSTTVNDIYVSGSTVYAVDGYLRTATVGSSMTFVKNTAANTGVADSVYVSGTTIYLTTYNSNGLQISTDGGSNCGLS